MKWTLPLARGRTWTWEAPQLMAILNATPDSFSDGGQLDDEEAVRQRVRACAAAGVNVFDVGGESTRPGHEPVDAAEEMARVVPVIAAVRDELPDAIISIDTSKASVARAALEAGADWVNDVSGLGDPGMALVVKQAGCAIALMRHETLEGESLVACRMQIEDLLEKAADAGLDGNQIVVDPGLGFAERPGASVRDNMALLQGIGSYAHGRPVLIGHSRKRFVATLADEAGTSLDEMTARLCVTAREAGAALLRVHDVQGCAWPWDPPA